MYWVGNELPPSFWRDDSPSQTILLSPKEKPVESAAKNVLALKNPKVMTALVVMLGIAYYLSPYLLFAILGLIAFRLLHTAYTLVSATIRDGWEIARLELTVAMQGVQLNELNADAEVKRRIDVNKAKLKGEEPEKPTLQVIDGGRKAS